MDSGALDSLGLGLGSHHVEEATGLNRHPGKESQTVGRTKDLNDRSSQEGEAEALAPTLLLLPTPPETCIQSFKPLCSCL